MRDEVTINVRMVKRVFRVMACVGVAFIPFAMGAILLNHSFREPQHPDLGSLLGSFAFFLSSATFVWIGVARENQEELS
jgi:hypothetical protein